MENTDELPWVVALTGGIASGKTTVSDLFKKFGTPVVDTDAIAKSLLQSRTPTFEKVVSEFGKEILDDSGRVNRAALRRRIFNVSSERSRLNKIMHPAIIRETISQLKNTTSPYCLVVVPLLTEIGVPEWVDRVLVVDTPVATQLARLKTRDLKPYEENINAIQSQAGRDARLAIADDVIDNSGELDTLVGKVKKLDRKYRREASMPRENNSERT